MEHIEWLKARKNGIGGSDVSAICGLNKYKSPIGVYLEKVEREVQGQEQSEAAYWGNRLEEIVAKEFTKRTGKKVRSRNVILQHKDYPWMLANLDRVVVGERAILECKTANSFLAKEWDGEEVPAAYILQVQHYLAVTGYKTAYIACLIGGQKFIHKTIERDNEIIEYLIEMEKEFWVNHVEKREPPKIDGSEASSKVISMLYPEAKSDEEIVLDKDISKLINKRIELKEQEEHIKEKINEIDNQIKSSMGEHSKAIAGDFRVTWSNSITSRFDSKSFKENCPNLYKQYLKQGSTRRLFINKVKEAK
ncbi:hypothetical protein CLCY_2c03350 [Clostridium cylindrosporum DSM 605]|uniref:YqaJ viral recombinase domain-containing protein n=2 Tax=Clostridium cylindrosporum TaxID=1495 RepID=A0A0J8DBB2_CLOCY|nr:hypothetical protein CLCY_2c03350 [Clostridium cylindrosporum DSM 605]